MRWGIFVRTDGTWSPVKLPKLRRQPVQEALWPQAPVLPSATKPRQAGHSTVQHRAQKQEGFYVTKSTSETALLCLEAWVNVSDVERSLKKEESPLSPLSVRIFFKLPSVVTYFKQISTETLVSYVSWTLEST